MDGHQELLETYRSLNDWLKALWLMTPPCFVLAVTGLLLHHRRKKSRHRAIPEGKPLYAMSRMTIGDIRIYTYTPEPVGLDYEKVRARGQGLRPDCATRTG